MCLREVKCNPPKVIIVQVFITTKILWIEQLKLEMVNISYTYVVSSTLKIR